MRLLDLFGQANVSEITAAVDGRRLAYFPTQIKDRLAAFSGWDDFTAALTLYDLQSTDLRLYKNGVVVPNQWLNRSVLGQDIDGRAFRDLARQGITLLLNRVERRSHALHTLWREAQTTLGYSVNLVYVATFGPGFGFPPHFDKDDQIAIQIAGLKEWQILGETGDVPLITESNNVATEPVTAKLTMQAGDVLVIPYGLGHRCYVQTSSLQLGILVKQPRAVDYFEWLLGKAQTVPHFGRRVPIDKGDADAVDTFREEFHRLIQGLMQDFPLEQFLDDQRQRISPGLNASDFPKV